MIFFFFFNTDLLLMLGEVPIFFRVLGSSVILVFLLLSTFHAFTFSSTSIGLLVSLFVSFLERFM